MRYFSYSEFDQFNMAGSGEKYMDKGFLKLIDELRHRCGFPLVVTSGYRSPEYNSQISSTGRKGAHTTGKAADIRVQGSQAHAVLKHALDLGFTGIGISQKGEHSKRFIHLDILEEGNGFPRPWVWSY